MGDGVLVLTFPMPPNLANARLHWRTKHRERKDYLDTLDVLACARTFPKPPRRPIARAVISSEMVLHAAMDDDNAMARHKWVLDWLVRRGYMVDDRRVNLRWAGLPSQIVSRKLPATITITLAPDPHP